jgi:hypothetical protein
MSQETTQEAPLSPFLEHQKRVMESRALQDRQIGERTRYTLPAAEKESASAKGAYVVESFDATNNRTERRTITPLPTPQRIQPAKPLSKEELIEMLDELRDEMATEQKKFDRKDAIDDDDDRELDAKAKSRLVAEIAARKRKR